MDLAAIIAAIAQIPYVGPYVVYIPAIIAIGAIIATVLPAPKPGANVVYTFLYELVQWCALNKGQGINLTSPKVNGLVAGPFALSAPAQAVTVSPVDKPTPVAPGTIPQPPVT